MNWNDVVLKNHLDKFNKAYRVPFTVCLLWVYLNELSWYKSIKLGV